MTHRHRRPPPSLRSSPVKAAVSCWGTRHWGRAWVSVTHGDLKRLGQLRFPSPSHLCSPVTCAAGVGLDLGAELYCLTCQEGLQHEASVDSSEAENMKLTDASIIDGSQRKRRIVRRSGGPTALPPKLYSCSLCTFSSHYSNHLKRHMRIHDGQKPYRCPVCPYASAQLVNLQRHARTHTGEKPYRCHHCNYACSSLGNLRRHQRMHTQERPERREKEKRHGRRKKGKAESNEGESLGSL